MKKKQEEDITVDKLEGLGQRLISDIKKGESPSFTSPLRGRENVYFDKETGFIKLGSKTERRTFLNVAQAKKFMQTVAVAAKCKKFKEENLHTSIRGLFYQLKFTLGEDIEEELFEEQTESVHPDDPIVVRFGDSLSISTGRQVIEETSRVGQVILGNPSVKIKGVTASTPSFDENQKISEHPVRSFIKHIHPRQMLDIQTRSGRRVRVTPSHSLFTVDEKGNIVPIKASKLKVGATIAVAREIKVKESAKLIDLYEVFRSASNKVLDKLYVHSDKRTVAQILSLCDVNKVKYITLYQWKKYGRIPLTLLYENSVPSVSLNGARLGIIGGKHTYPLQIEKSRELGTVLGYLLSEGSNYINDEREGARTVSFSNISKQVMTDFIEAFSKAFGKPTTRILTGQKRQGEKVFEIMRINIGYDLLSYILEFAFDYPAGTKSWDKTVPTVLLDSPTECVEGFLQAYVRGDGSHQSYKSIRVIRIYSASRAMINSIAFLLLRFGIFPRMCEAAVQKGRRSKYILYVGAKEYVQKLNSITGSLKELEFDEKASTSDLIPVKKLVAGVKKLCKIPDKEYHKINFYFKKDTISRPKLKRVIDLFEKYSDVSAKGHISKLKVLADSDIYWDQVKNIGTGEAPYTIDLSVVDDDKPIENFLGGFGWICLHNSNDLVEDLETALNVKREDLNLSTDRKGVVAGPLIIKDNFGGEETTIDCTKQGRSGWMIPSDVDYGMEFVKCTADYVLCIEKDALWQRLNEDQFWKKENCIIITPKGQASRGCRRLIRKLADLKVPIYCFMDCDAWGWYIYWTIKTGSINLAYLSPEIATPEAKFIGVTMKDLQTYDFLKKLTIRTKEVDIKRAEEMLGYPWIAAHPEWVEELKIVLASKKKLEQDALQGPRLTFVGEYIRDKIKRKDFLP